MQNTKLNNMKLKNLLNIISVFSLVIACSKQDTLDSICELEDLPKCEETGFLTPGQEMAVFVVVEDMPIFSGCDTSKFNVSDFYKRQYWKNCGDSLLVEFIEDNLEYPECAKRNQTEGTVVVRFNVEPDGSTKDCEITQSVGDGCDHEALRIVNSFPTWIPGAMRDSIVRVRLTLPIEFKL
ncbi:MAG: energy transducer TonB [Bacteroidota bacterium]